MIAGLQADYATETGIRSLKIKHNNVLGYFIEAPAAQGERMLAPPLNRPLHPPPDHGRRGALHHRRARRPRSRRSPAPPSGRSGSSSPIFDDLADAVAQAADPIKAIAEALAVLDVAAGLAVLAEARGPCAGRWSRSRWPSRSRAAATRWSSRRCAPTASPSSPTTAASAPRAAARPAASGWSPARTWPASRPSCARTR